jgi:hypothetical protein
VSGTALDSQEQRPCHLLRGDRHPSEYSGNRLLFQKNNAFESQPGSG